MKACTKCGAQPPAAEFGKNAARHDGLQAWCKACRHDHYRKNSRRIRQRERVRRAADREAHREYSRRWYAANSERAKKQARAWLEAHPGADASHSLVYQAVKHGKLRPQPCCVCGSERAEAHHWHGYDKAHRLDVVWMCRPCHKQTHADEKESAA